MSDDSAENPQDTPLNIPSTDPIEPKTIAVTAPKASGAMRLLVTFLLLAVIGLAVALAGVVNFALQEKQKLDDKHALVADKTSDIHQYFKDLQNDTHQKLSGFDQQIDNKLAKNHTVVDGKIADVMAQINAISSTTETDWRLAEVEYLTRLAAHRIYLARDIAGASKLLTTAAEILMEIPDPSLLPVRQVLAEDIAKVRAASQQDDVEVYLKLKALVPQVYNLPIFRQPELNVDAENSSLELQGWDRLTESFSRVATQYFQVRRNTNIKPLLSSEDESTLRQLIHLKMEQAASALLHGKTEVFKNNLQQVHQLVAENFLIDEQVVIAFLKAVDELLAENINAELPDISSSHQAVSLFIEKRHNLNLKGRVQPRPAATVSKPLNKTESAVKKPVAQANQAKQVQIKTESKTAEPLVNQKIVDEKVEATEVDANNEQAKEPLAAEKAQ